MLKLLCWHLPAERRLLGLLELYDRLVCRQHRRDRMPLLRGRKIPINHWSRQLHRMPSWDLSNVNGVIDDV